MILTKTVVDTEQTATLQRIFETIIQTCKLATKDKSHVKICVTSPRLETEFDLGFLEQEEFASTSLLEEGMYTNRESVLQALFQVDEMLQDYLEVSVTTRDGLRCIRNSLANALKGR